MLLQAEAERKGKRDALAGEDSASCDFSVPRRTPGFPDLALMVHVGPSFQCSQLVCGRLLQQALLKQVSCTPGEPLDLVNWLPHIRCSYCSRCCLFSCLGLRLLRWQKAKVAGARSGSCGPARQHGTKACLNHLKHASIRPASRIIVGSLGRFTMMTADASLIATCAGLFPGLFPDAPDVDPGGLMLVKTS